MDAASRTELDRLRRRAYGPRADLHRDPGALRRLIDLEGRVLAERAGWPQEQPAPPGAATEPMTAAAPAAVDAAPPAPAADQPEPAADQPGPSTPRPAIGRAPLSRRAALAFAAAGGAAILAISAVALVRAAAPPPPAETGRTILAPAVREARTAYSFAWDREAVPLLQIPLDGSFGRYIDLPTAAEVPEFPATGTVEWAYPLGRYFGWDVWIAGASVDETGLQREHCIVVERNDDVRGRCVPAQLRQQSALLVSVPFASVDPEDRPVGMEPDERLGFWWNHDRAVTVMLGEDP